jgi:hypothetical protein
LVEAELGKLAGEEDGLTVDLKEMKMTDPVKAGVFFQQTQVVLTNLLVRISLAYLIVLAVTRWIYWQ